MPTATLRCRCGCKTRGRRETMLITPSKAAFINADHAAAYASKNYRKNQHSIAKRAKGIEKAFQKRKRGYYENDYAHQFDLTKKAAQKLANRLDGALVCISCGCERTVQFCGGHFRTVGAHRELALDLRNIHGQCNRNCNMGLSGNIAGTKRTRGFRAGLLARYGQAFVDFLETAHPAERVTCEMLIAKRKEFNAEIRRLEKGLPPSKDWRSIEQDSRLSGRAQDERDVA